MSSRKDPWDIAIDMRGRGIGYAAVAAETGISEHRLRARLDPEYMERRRQQARARRNGTAGPKSLLRVSRSLSVEEAQRIIYALPRDTRDFTARVMGDPLPGRSALDRMRGCQQV